ncbi:MAG TPA: PAS domain S-box protein, partial [bacterium (Candidatus Stahlbacteria)]|nr:PAS domain S-box protein [Candidatus Stahlbacteria bacterium]
DDLKISYCNDAYAQFVGRKANQLLGRYLLEVFPQFEQTEAFTAYEQALKTGIPQKVEDRSGNRFFQNQIFRMSWGLLVIGYDITELKAAEEALKESEGKYRVLVEQLQQGLVIAQGPELHLVFVNQALADITGYSKEELQTAGLETLRQIIHPDDRDIILTGLSRRLKGEDIPSRYEVRVIRKDGEVRHLEMTSKQIDFMGQPSVQATVIDITDRKRVENQLQKALKDWEDIFQAIGQPTLILDSEHRIIQANQAALTTLGKTVDEINGRICYEIFHRTDQPPEGCPFEKLLVSNRLETEEMPMEALDGTFLVSCTPIAGEDGRLERVIHIATSITERLNVEEELKTEKAYLEKLFESVQEAIVMCDNDGLVLNVNDEFVRLFGYDADEIIGRPVDDLIVPEKLHDDAISITQYAALGKKTAIETVRKHKDGSLVDVSIYAAPIVVGDKQIGVYGTYRDITERKKAEQWLIASEQKYRTLVEQSIQGIVIIQDQRIVFANPAFAEISGYTVDEMLALTPEEIQRMVHPDDQALVWGRMAARLRGEDVPQRYEYRGVRKDGATRWLEMFAHLIEYQDKPAVQGVIVDITTRKEVEKELQQSFDRMEQTIDNTLEAMAKILETRDPYTAGHQQRVATLAVAIAEEMGLNGDQIRGLQVAAVIHDIGKIYVPAEILTRPTELTDSEFTLIKSHPKIGYEILKTIDFPWPVAEIVLQHHERFDGSGYPGGLKGEKTLLEARILAVADVVEAMSSHRPYRPAKDLEATLEEISSRKGILYDPAVVDACLKVVSRKDFKY